MDETLNLFNLGYLSIELRALAERLFWAVCRKLQRIVRELDYVPEELQGLETMLSDTYFCNFSVFQSMPDSWAIKQLFPIMPIHRLNEAPTRRAVLATSPATRTARSTSSSTCATCAARWSCTRSTGEPYYLGAFLLGAYQEILGDLHNLFGDTNAVHVSLDDDGDVEPRHGHQGRHGDARCWTTCSTRAEKLTDRMRKDVEKAVRHGQHLGGRESQQFLRFYETGLEGYTYLEEPSA